MEKPDWKVRCGRTDRLLEHYSEFASFLGLLALMACGEAPSQPEATQSPDRPASSSVAASNTWLKRANMPRVRGGPAVATVTDASGQSIVYVIGGGAGLNSVSRLVYAYNVTTDTWASVARLPVGLTLTNGAVAINGKIYVSGGVKQTTTQDPNVPRRELYVYDPVTNTWVQKRSMLTRGSEGISGMINNELYVLTACVDCDPFVLAFSRYDPVTDQWTRLGNPRFHHIDGAGAVIQGKFYVASGRLGIPMVESYDPLTSQWTTRAPMPLGRCCAAGAALNGKLYVIGGAENDGEGHESAVSTTSMYDPVTDTWTTRAPIFDLRTGITGTRVFLNGRARIEVLGGLRPNNLQYIP